MYTEHTHAAQASPHIKQDYHLPGSLLNPTYSTLASFFSPSSFQLRGSTVKLSTHSAISAISPDGRRFSAVANLWKVVLVSASCWCRHARAISTCALVSGKFNSHVFNGLLHCTAIWSQSTGTVWQGCFGSIRHLTNRLSNSTNTINNCSTTWGLNISSNLNTSELDRHHIIHQTTVNGCP